MAYGCGHTLQLQETPVSFKELKLAEYFALSGFSTFSS
jgi:hypothetical protein